MNLLTSSLIGVAVFHIGAQVFEAKPQQVREPSGVPSIEESTPPPFDDYPLNEDSQPQLGVPRGRTFQFELQSSEIFPYTRRSITVYIPAEYNPDKPACLFVFLDGIRENAPVVFDNLIAQHAMPITIAIGVSPGSVVSNNPPENARFDRSFEFDSMTDRLARFLVSEVIPAVERHHTPDGKPIRLSENPDDRAITGASTGAIAAFTVAWQHPEAFHRVFTSVGTFVGMHGGEGYYVQVRKTEPKPLRIFMEDGMNDEWPGGIEIGDWWMSNLTMNRALEAAGYDVAHSWGAGTHNGSHATAIFPDVVRWLWRDWPQPIQAKAPGNPILREILKQGEGWRIAAEGCGSNIELHADTQGRVFYSAAQAPLYAVLDHQIETCAGQSADRAFAIGPDDKIYRARLEGGLELVSPGKRVSPFAEAGKLSVSALTVRANGDIYAVVVDLDGKKELWLFPMHGLSRRLDDNLMDAADIALSPDGLWLLVTRRDSRYGLSYRVRKDGSVDAREPFYDFYLPPGGDYSDATQIAMDSIGRAYIATALGIQILDRNGRVVAILPLPTNDVPCGITFGGPDFDVLYVAVAGKLYKRHLGVRGALPWANPIRLSPWGAG